LRNRNQQRHDNMIISPLNTLDLIPDGNDLEAVEIRLLKLDPVKPFGNGTIQSAFAEDASGHKASVRFMDFDPLGADWIGPWMRINATRNGKNELVGLSVDSYNNRKRLNIKGVDQHGRNRVTIDWLEGVPAAPAPAAAQPARQGPPAHRDDIVYDHQRPQQPARPPMGPPPRQAGPPTQSARPPQQAQPPAQPRPPAGPHGATVGMAVKEAFTALVKGVRPEAITDEVRNRVFWQDVHQCASEILHVCKALESGDIAPSIVTAALPDYPAEEAAASEEPWPQD
jgi:hypothetical protein